MTPDELENSVMYENILAAANSANALFIILPMLISLTHNDNIDEPDTDGCTLMRQVYASRYIRRSSIAAQSPWPSTL